MKRTYILLVLVLAAGAYVMKMKYLWPRDGLAAAKERIRLVEQQPVARSVPAASHGAVAAPARAPSPQGPQPEPAQPQTAPSSAATDESERVPRLVKGTFTLVDGTIVYSADAQLDLGHGMLVSSPTGVMVSDEEQQHISGDLVVETAEAKTSMENAFLTLDKAQMTWTSDSATTEKKDGPN
jgi:hypothetical protein